MTKKYINVFSTLILCCVVAACTAHPPKKTYISKVVKGDSIPGEIAGYIYNLKKQGNTGNYLLTKKKYCFEKVEKLAHERKRIQDAEGAAATVLAPVGIIAPRTGIPLVMTGFEKSRGHTVKKIGTLDTGRIMPCGEYEPAKDEMLLLQTSEMKIIRNVRSDKNGQVDLKKVIASAGSALYLNVFVEHEDSLYLVATKYIR